MIDPVEFPLIAKRLSGATLWSTDIQDGLNGDEVRNANWQDSLRRFNAAYGIRSLADQAVLENWHIVCLGPAIGFLLKDWKDFQATHTATSFGNNATRRGLSTCTNAPTNTVFQLEQVYSNGYRTHRRKITRPKSGTVVLYEPDTSNVIGSGYSIDYATGLVTFTGARGTAPDWDGDFYVPVRFQDDEIPWDIIMRKLADGAGYGDLPEVIMVEVRE